MRVLFVGSSGGHLAQMLPLAAPDGDRYHWVSFATPDARSKLVALADYSEQYGDHFVRIESLSQTDNGLMVLDLQNPTVRSAIRAFTGTQVAALYESSAATPYS